MAKPNVFKRAKQIKKQHPHKYDRLSRPWQDGYVAEAARSIKKKSTGGHKKAAKKKGRRKGKVGAVNMPAKRHIDNNRFRNVDISIGSVRSHIAKAKKGLELSLEKKMLQQWKAKTVTKRKKIGKKIADLKSQINKLS